MELLRYHSETFQPIHLVSIDNRANCPVTLAIKENSTCRHTTRHQRIPHTFRLINPIQTILITTNQNLLNLPSLIQLFCCIDAINEEVVRNPVKSRLWSSPQQQPHLVVFNTIDVRVHLPLSIVHHNLVAYQYYGEAYYNPYTKYTYYNFDSFIHNMFCCYKSSIMHSAITTLVTGSL